MPVTVAIDPAPNSIQAQVINDATPFNDGVMTKAQAAKLAGLVPSAGSGSFQISISQPADGSDFTVTIPLALRPPTASFGVNITIATANEFTSIATSYVDNTLTTFRVTTDGTLPDGTLLNCFIQPF